MFQNNHIMRIWDANTGAQIGDLLHGHDDTVFSVAFSPDGTRIVSGSSDGTVRIWDANTGAQIGDPLHGHDDTVFSMALGIWDTTTGVQLQGHDHLVRHAPNNTIYGSMANSLPTFRTTQGVPINMVPQDHCNPQSSQAHHNWSLSQNGWIKLPNSPPNVILIPP
ncbi:WD40 repeat-like protein [Gymnopus androsaceus JB14]|uniref:WD40 repeat-like protein n=1 Tax=Gymnopus androsaceus JB14 TaxID=1447944 RepID=A0A6A4GLQ2_9AGAR|nr:WD40 repeat-like protein [Gymnopus androsaceus JB14]